MDDTKKSAKIIESKDFEKSLKKLESIVEQLESGSLSLDKSIKLYEEGKGLGSGCLAYLTEVEQKLLKIVDADPDDVKVEEFN